MRYKGLKQKERKKKMDSERKEKCWRKLFFYQKWVEGGILIFIYHLREPVEIHYFENQKVLRICSYLLLGG